MFMSLSALCLRKVRFLVSPKILGYVSSITIHFYIADNHQFLITFSRWNSLTDEYIRLQTFIEIKLNLGALEDLRIQAQRTIDKLTEAQQTGVFARTRRFKVSSSTNQ